jgi:hypothetical protein
MELASAMKAVLTSRKNIKVETNRFHGGVEELARKICESFEADSTPELVGLINGFFIRVIGGKVFLTTDGKANGGVIEDLSKEGLFSTSNEEKTRMAANGLVLQRPSAETVEDFGRAVEQGLVDCAEMWARVYGAFLVPEGGYFSGGDENEEPLKEWKPVKGSKKILP